MIRALGGSWRPFSCVGRSIGPRQVMSSRLEKTLMVVLAVGCCVTTSWGQTPTPTASCIGDTWMATSVNNAPTAREWPTGVWTGSDMIVWGGDYGYNGSSQNTGGRYNPSADNWATTSIAN